MSRINVVFSDDMQELTALLKPYPAVFIVSDRKLRRFITEPLAEACAEAGVALRGVLQLKLSERRKNLTTVGKILSWLMDAGADRDALVLAVGGGITTDLAGFAACIYKRGVKYANVPTTLLAQVDAATGGKTGCNIGGVKNMAGSIRQSEFTYVNTAFLRTLPWEEYSAGYAELLKTFIIGDPEAYAKAVELEDPVQIGPLVRRAVEIKASIVERDEFDTGERRLLNLGHTFAHAIECRSARSFLRKRISHGHAVAMGIIMAARLSEERHIAPKGLAASLEEDFIRAGLPVLCPWSMEELLPIMRKDKKCSDGQIRFVLLRGIGDCVI